MKTPTIPVDRLFQIKKRRLSLLVYKSLSMSSISDLSALVVFVALVPSNVINHVISHTQMSPAVPSKDSISSPFKLISIRAKSKNSLQKLMGGGI